MFCSALLNKHETSGILMTEDNEISNHPLTMADICIVRVTKQIVKSPTCFIKLAFTSLNDVIITNTANVLCIP